MHLRPALPALALALLSSSARADAPWDGPPFSADPRAVLDAAEALSPPAGAAVDLLLEEATFRFDARGAATLEHRVVFRVLVPDAARAWTRVERGWSPWNQARPEVRARVITPRGEVHELDPATLADQGAGDDGGGEIYTDRKVLTGPLPAIRTGAVVELVAVLRDTAPAFDGGTSARFYLAQPVPARRVRLRVEAPASLPLRLVVRGHSPAPREVVKDGVRSYVVDRRDVPAAVAPDPGAPRDVPAAPYAAFGWGRSWADAAERYGELVERQLRGADLAAAARAALGEGKPDRAEAVRRVVAWVHQNVRYTGLELGEAAVVPAAPADTLRRRYGDCKDLSLLLVGLLREAGLPARIALVRGAWDEVQPELPGVSQFDHAVVRVDGPTPIWIDATDPFTEPGRLPPPVEGRLALVTGRGTRDLVRTPETPPEAHRVRTVRELQLAGLGRGRIVETRELTGALATAERTFRAHLAPDRRAGLEERYVKEVLRGELGGAAVEGQDDPAVPLRVRVEATGSDAVRTDDDEARVPVTPDQVFDALPSWVNGQGGGEERSTEPPPARRQDLVLTVPYRWEIVYRVHPADGFRARPLPADGEEAFGPARYARTYRLEADGSVTATFRFDTGGRRLAAADADRLARRVREIVKGASPAVVFERTAAALLAAGRVPEALAEMRRLAALHPSEAVHPLHLAVALLDLGYAEAAAAEARRALALEPERAWGWRVLGWILEHDAVGRLHGPGFDRAAALDAYRKARKLDPDHAGGRAALAELLAHSPAGVRHGPGADLDGALAEYRSIAEDLDEHGFDVGRLSTLFAAGRLDAAEDLARAMPRGPERDALLLATVAARRGAPAAEEEAASLGDGRREALREAARLLVRQRRYGPAPALAEAATRGARDAAETRQLVEVFRGLVRWEELPEPGDPPARLVRRLFSAALRAEDPRPEVGALLARGWIPPELLDTAAAGVAAPALQVRAAAHREGVSPDVLLDLVLARLELHPDGDAATGLRLRLRLPYGGEGSAVLFAVRDGKELRLLASDASWPLLGEAALRRLDQGDLDGARRWLDWAREVVPGATGEPASPAGVLAALWRPGAAADAARARRASHALLAFADAKGRTLAPLEEALAAATDPAERRALGFAVAQAARAAGRDEALLAAAERLLADDPASREAFYAQVVALQRLRRPEALDTAARAFLSRLPDDADAQAVIANARLSLGDLEGAARDFRRLVDGGRATPAVLNNAAWLELFRGGDRKLALGWARRAVEGERAPNHPSLNTLAAVYADAGQPAEAREIFLRSLEAEGGIAPSASDWYAFGRIAEAYGLPDAARAAYGRVAPDPDDPTAPFLLAKVRLAELGAPPAAANPAPAKGPATAPPAGPATPATPPGPRPEPPRKPAPPKAPATGGRTVPA